MSKTHITLGQISEDNLWYDGNDLHCIDESGVHYRIENYLTEWYVSDIKYSNLDYETNENIAIVGNNKRYKNHA